jgi:DNA polymerase-3 subunit epsilon
MEFVVSPDVAEDPDVLISAGMRAGLAYSEKLNRTSSLVVCNRNQPLRGKAMHGHRKNIPLFTDAEFLAALDDVAAGAPPGDEPDPRPATPRIPAPQKSRGRSGGSNRSDSSGRGNRGGRGSGLCRPGATATGGARVPGSPGQPGSAANSRHFRADRRHPAAGTPPVATTPETGTPPAEAVAGAAAGPAAAAAPDRTDPTTRRRGDPSWVCSPPSRSAPQPPPPGPPVRPGVATAE